MLEKYKKKIKEYVLNAEPLLMVYNSIIFIEIIALACILFIEYVMKYQKDGLLMMVFLWIYLIVMAVLANLYPKKVQLFSSLIIAPVNLIMFPYMFLFADGGGIKSGMPIWMTFGIILVCIMTNGIYFKIILLLSVVVDTSILIYGYFNLELFYNLEGEHYYYWDNLIAILAVSSSIGLILKYQKYMEGMQARKLEGAMIEAEQEKNNAQKANTAKTRFLASMSHDIRTPMNAIVGMTDIARYNIDNQDKVKECLEKINASSTQLLNLLNNILDMSEIEMGELKLKENQFSMEELIENIQVVFAQMARSKKVSFEVDCEMEHVNLLGDSVRLRQILMNIISNSIKYTEAFGKVNVYIKETASDKEGYVAFDFEVVDTGMGMTKEFIENKLFQPFERAENKAVRKIEGNGIGMSITKNIIDAMGAVISVDSTVGEGSRFLVHADFKEDEKYQNNFVVEKDGVAILDATGMNLLVVEDNEINMEIIKAILERTHVHITCAWDAEEAIDIFSKSQEGHFDLILMDIQLPGMDGYEATRMIRCMERKDALSIPIIAMTANAFAQDVEKAFNAGMNAHIAKPIDVEELFRKMYHFLYTV